MSKKSVEITGISTSNIKVLSDEEIKSLFIKMKNGDPFAREDLIKGNLKLVLSILRKFNGRVDNMDDLFQVGCIGLVKAIDNFSLDFNTKLSTYAVPMILGEVKRYLRDNSSVKVTRNLKDIAYKANLVKERLTNEFNKEPTIKQIADVLELEEIEVVEALDAMKEAMSMFEPIYNDGGDTIYLSEQIADKSDKIGQDMLIQLKDANKSLKKKERFIIYKRYFEGITQMELSKEIGISQAQISRIEKNSLEKMKKLIK